MQTTHRELPKNEAKVKEFNDKIVYETEKFQVAENDLDLDIGKQAIQRLRYDASRQKSCPLGSRKG